MGGGGGHKLIVEEGGGAGGLASSFIVCAKGNALRPNFRWRRSGVFANVHDVKKRQFCYCYCSTTN